MTHRLHTSGESLVQCELASIDDTSYLANLGSGWNRLANAVVGDKLSKDVLSSAKFYAQLNYALANAAIASWDSK
jgi:hypothetical protein